MTHVSEPTRIDSVRGAAATPATAAAAVAPGFAALLERLQRLTAPRPEQLPAGDVESLRAGLAAADESFTTAMDLRRQLEEAFRRHAP
jgi:hypothetical protein